MMRKSFLAAPFCGIFLLGLAVGGCVSSSTHDQTLNELRVEREKNQALTAQLAGAKEETSNISVGAAKQLTSYARQLEELKKQAARQTTEMSQLSDKLKGMIDAGALTITTRKGRMIVSLPSDIMFASGSVKISPEGHKTIQMLANALGGFKERTFLIVGHSDATPIAAGNKYATNWDLSSARAVEVVKLLIKNEVNPAMLIAGGNAEFDPLALNDSPENKQKNRRVELIFLPNMEILGATPAPVAAPVVPPSPSDGQNP